MAWRRRDKNYEKSVPTEILYRCRSVPERSRTVPERSRTVPERSRHSQTVIRQRQETRKNRDITVTVNITWHVIGSFRWSNAALQSWSSEVERWTFWKPDNRQSTIDYWLSWTLSQALSNTQHTTHNTRGSIHRSMYDMDPCNLDIPYHSK